MSALEHRLLMAGTGNSHTTAPIGQLKYFEDEIEFYLEIAIIITLRSLCIPQDFSALSEAFCATHSGQSLAAAHLG